MSALIPLKILIPISLVVIILIVVLWVLYSKNRKIFSKMLTEKRRFNKYKVSITNLKNNQKNPKKDFTTLNNIARNFFKEYLNLSPSLTYLELEAHFRKQQKQDYANFCRLMSNTNYSGWKTSENLSKLINQFYNLIASY